MKTFLILIGIVIAILVIKSSFNFLHTQSEKVARRQIKEINRQRDYELLTDSEKGIITKLQFVEDEEFLTYKRSVTVFLPHKVEEQTLVKIGKMIKEEHQTAFEKTFINYFLPGMNVGEESCWAYTHFTPELEYQINHWAVQENNSIAERE